MFVFACLQDETLRRAVCTYNAKSWKKIGKRYHFPFPPLASNWCHSFVVGVLYAIVYTLLNCLQWVRVLSTVLVVWVSVYFGFCSAEFFPDRTEVQCLHRWQKVLNPDLIKGPWMQEVPFYSLFLLLFCWLFIVCMRALKVFFVCRRMRRSLNLLKNTVLRNGLLSQSL